MKFKILILSVILLVVLGCNKKSTENIEIVINEGMSAHNIADMLKNNGIIKNEKIFIALIKLTRIEKKLKTGTYKFSKPSSYIEVMKKIKNGEGMLIKIVIPEGFSKYEIAERLHENGLVNKEKILKIIDDKKLEGYLFPETYYFSGTLKEDQILNEMKLMFEKKVNPVFDNVDLKLSKEEIIILASIIEKEAMLQEERPIISSVFYNRLKQGKYLESCVTVQYALGNQKKRLSYEDLKVQSPYNTYKHKGLPPTPICSPGIESIKAAIAPADTKYLFFVKNKNNDGSHIFSTTFQDHIKAKKQNIGK